MCSEEEERKSGEEEKEENGHEWKQENSPVYQVFLARFSGPKILELREHLPRKWVMPERKHSGKVFPYPPIKARLSVS